MGVVEPRSDEQLGLDFPALLDLRLFSQSDLYSLSRASSSASIFYDNDDVLVPKIDRSLFNESAGSRKQTYSRLRFATRKLQFSSAEISPNVSFCRQFPEEERSEIVTLLKQLFADESPICEKNEECISDEDEGLVSIHIGRGSDEAAVDGIDVFIQNIPVEVVSEMGELKTKKRGRPRKNENPSNVAVRNISHDVVPGIGEQGKRKRGRPRKNEIQDMCISAVASETAKTECLDEAMDTDKEKMIFNEHGNVIDLAVRNTENQFAEALGEQRKRKRGRPRKNENQGIHYAPVVHETVGREYVEGARDMEKDELIVNQEGNVLDLAASVNTEDHHGEELGDQRKRKRGRPHKNEYRGIRYAPVEHQTLGREHVKEVWDMKKETVTVNENGNVVDLAMLGRMENPFEEELLKRTEGMETEAELLGFLRGLDGYWGSWRERRKIVRASDFGEILPKDWRLILSLKKRKGIVWLHCHRYISPNGRQFVSYKEVSSYLLSLYGLQGAKLVESGHIGEGQLASSTVARHNADLNREDGSGAVIVSSSPLLVASIPSNHEDQSIFLENSNTLNAQRDEALKCLHWNMAFNEKNDFEAPAVISPEECKNV